METIVHLINETYKGWTFEGIEKVKGAYRGIAHEKHCGDFLLLHFSKENKKENFLLCEGEEDFINIYPFEQTKKLLLETTYSSDCSEENSDSFNDFCLQYLNNSSSDEEKSISSSKSESVYSSSDNEDND
uniref:Uncharacterized protein n=1 Tax=viral metagenome TaxID=1070528 RepID=A0A6C0KQ25_9ZZZZ